MHKYSSNSTYCTPLAEVVRICAGSMLAASDMVGMNASLEDYEVIDLCE